MSKRNKSNNQIQRKPILRGMVVSAYPTPEQIKLFQNSFSNNRAVYNMALALRKRYYRIFKKTLSKSRLQRWLVKKKKNPHFSWISTSPSQAYLVTFARKDFLHKTAYALLVKNHATTLVFESLNVKGLILNKKLSRYIQDVSWGAFISIIEDKCDKMGKNLIKVNKFYPSSKTCSVCGNKKDKLLLSERVYSCSHCSTVIDRDYNAALNIKQEGMRLVQPLL